jgi:hypothetical protein
MQGGRKHKLTRAVQSGKPVRQIFDRRDWEAMQAQERLQIKRDRMIEEISSSNARRLECDRHGDAPR